MPDPSYVYVFGANAEGYHGGAAARSAWEGTDDKDAWDAGNWPKAVKALNNKNAGRKASVKDLTGAYAVLGQTGLQKGTLGYSYGFITLESPGVKGFVDDDYIINEFVLLIECAKDYPDLTFKCTTFGLKRPMGFSYWSVEEMNTFINKAIKREGEPANIEWPSYYQKKAELKES